MATVISAEGLALLRVLVPFAHEHIGANVIHPGIVFQLLLGLAARS